MNSRSATRTGPGIVTSLNAYRRTVRGSVSSWRAASSCDQPNAANAARNSSADNGATIKNAQPMRSERGGNGLHRVVLPEAVGQRAIGAEQRQAFGAINAAGNKPDGVGGKVGGDGCVAHASYVGQCALSVNGVL